MFYCLSRENMTLVHVNKHFLQVYQENRKNTNSHLLTSLCTALISENGFEWNGLSANKDS